MPINWLRNYITRLRDFYRTLVDRSPDHPIWSWDALDCFAYIAITIVLLDAGYNVAPASLMTIYAIILARLLIAAAADNPSYSFDADPTDDSE